MDKVKHINHLYLRAAFGAHPSYVEKRKGKSIRYLVDELFEQSKEIKTLNTLKNPVEDKPAGNFRLLVMVLKSRKQIIEMGHDWITQTAHYPYPSLREKMTFFWHSHFATRIPLAYLMQVQNNSIRKHALGNFRELLHTMAKDPAMIVFLNNQQNRKKHPNENFARELMELFTLGEGHYSETDIKEAARAFTRWHINRYGSFEFNSNEHDYGEKTFKGASGRLSGENVIDVLLKDKQCALFITQKIYSFFVNTKPDEKKIAKLADEFYQSNYDIAQLMKSIFTSDWFYHKENVGTKIASPIELILRYHTLLQINNTHTKSFTRILQVLGQEMFYPPNVAGWPSGRNWIDSSSMMLRMKLPFIFFEDYPQSFSNMEDDDAQFNNGKERKLNIDSKANWKNFATSFKEIKDDKLIDEMANALLQIGYSSDDQIIIDLFKRGTSHEEKIKSIAIHLFALPEFQLV
ncbi:MAG TPA: DUF1800 domain-containing protein [Bacteroidia bacterium]|nr:DUF1800 domain-containing protein [Bacteroidia bacterium]